MEFRSAGPHLLVAHQRGLDVEIEVEAKGGSTFVVDSPFDRRGQETVLLEGGKRYQVTIRSREVGAPRGSYSLRLEAIPRNLPKLDARLDGFRALTEAARLYRLGTRENWREALEHYQGALVFWQDLEEVEKEAEAWFAQGVLHRLLDEPKAGLEASLRALDLFRLSEEAYLEAYASNEIGLGHWRLGALDEARESFRRAAALGERLTDDFVMAAATSNRCLMALSAGALEEGRECYESSLPAIERAQAAQIESAARTNLGRITEHLGEPAEAHGHYRRALEIHAATGDRRGQAQTLNNLGVLLSGAGDLDSATARYVEALEIFQALGEPRWQARTLSNLGYADRAVGESKRALVNFGRALELFRQAEDRRGEATILGNLGLVKRELGEPAEALDLHRRALELRRLLGHRRGEAMALCRLGEILFELGETDAAQVHLRQAIALASEIGGRQIGAAGRLALGKILLDRGELGSAQEELELALGLASEAGQRTTEGEILFYLARVDRAAGLSESARSHIDSALERFEEVRSSFESPQLRTSYSSLLRRAYELDVELWMEAHGREPEAGHDRRALEVTERTRARTLLELLQEADIDLARGVSPELLSKRLGLARRLEAKTDRLLDAKLDAAIRQTLQREQLSLLQHLEVLDAEIRRESPAFGELVRPQALDTEEIRALVDEETTLAVYFFGESKSILWRVTSTAIDAFELPSRRVIEAAARRVHLLWSDLDVASRSLDHSAAEDLAGLLRLPTLLGSRRLAVIADGALHLVPFAALPVESMEGGGRSVPLVSRVEIVSLPSASVLALDRRLHGARPPRPTVAILADPTFGPEYAQLPGSRREAEAIAQAMQPAQSHLILGAEANREALEDPHLRDYDILHFATHGVIDTENPAFSGLVLSQVDAKGRAVQGFLRLHDVFGLNLDSELVVLSGCRTALGPEVRGEGLIGLARGFMYAGSRRVVASLWQVEDQATAALMTSFYRAMGQEGASAATALAAAQRELAEGRRFRDPYYWAGFVLVGDWH
ncbi:MAG: CHAT domain-containing protein [Deltaproteobacteria bacterium]|nr:CHAT domain-containing protein [Deltaproteobacteria bacterium]